VNVRLLGQNGNPLPGAEVYTHNAGTAAHSRSGTDGIAVFHLPSGSYPFTVYPSETYIASREFPTRSITGPETFDLDISGAVWSGTVRRAGDGAPLSGIQVAAIGHTSGYSFGYILSDAAGAFHLIVERNAAYYIRLVDEQAGDEVGSVPYIFAGSDSTFDLFANVPVP
jgi:hypothetical protein